ncbi:MAG: hypothetical protein PVG74_05715 [Desulfobacterales bacterium]|jgi:hypothetical protein
MKKIWYWGLIVVFLFLTGCATVPVYTSDPTTQTVENDLFVMELEPHLAPGKSYFDSFRYIFWNKSNTILEIDWQNTFYLKNGVSFGRWAKDELTIEDIQEEREQPRIEVAPGNTLSGLIYPMKLIAKRSPTLVSLTDMTRDEPFKTRGIIPESESGMLLTVRQGDRLIREKLICRITITYMRK